MCSIFSAMGRLCTTGVLICSIFSTAGLVAYNWSTNAVFSLDSYSTYEVFSLTGFVAYNWSTYVVFSVAGWVAYN